MKVRGEEGARSPTDFRKEEKKEKDVREYNKNK